MGYEWDAENADAHFKKHGVSFERGSHIFENPVFQREDDRIAYGEPRIIALGESDGGVLVVVYTQRGDNRRIISVRKASPDERELYYSAVRHLE
ncbi:MAG: BrnT family toxin [Parvularculaceae bacterium]